MKKTSQTLTADDVRYILDDKLQETGLDQVPKRLDLLDRILTSVDKLVGEVKGYREEQELNANKIINHDDQLEKQTHVLTELKHIFISRLTHKDYT
jgi:HD superfamily phosphodiesterase